MKLRSLTPLLVLFAVGACDSPGDSNIGPAPELITMVRVTLHDSLNLHDSVMLQFAEVQGPDGTTKPEIIGDTLHPGTTYFGRAEFFTYDGIKVVSINEEILDAGTSHQVFFTPKEGIASLMQVDITDRDVNNLPLGLNFTLRTQTIIVPASGKLNVVLSHYEQPGSKNGTDRSDESDVDIEFPITVQ